MQFSEKVKATLWNLIDVMSSDLSDFTVNPQKDFTRKKKWDFPTLIKFIISMESQSLKNELHKYFGYTTDCPTNASFNQRRSQIKSDAFKYLFESFTNLPIPSARCLLFFVFKSYTYTVDPLSSVCHTGSE